jgi:hypothetical protein
LVKYSKGKLNNIKRKSQKLKDRKMQTNGDGVKKLKWEKKSKTKKHKIKENAFSKIF